MSSFGPTSNFQTVMIANLRICIVALSMLLTQSYLNLTILSLLSFPSPLFYHYFTTTIPSHHIDFHMLPAPPSYILLYRSHSLHSFRHN